MSLQNLSCYQSPSPRKRLHYGQSVKSMSSVPISLMLDSPGYAERLLSRLNHLRGGGMLCDYVLVTDTTEIPVHRAVMAACSEYFQVMFAGDMRESKQDRVVLQGVTPVGLQAVVAFAYTGKLDVNLENVEEILAAASHLQVTDVVSLACLFIEQVISVENCVDVLNMAELYSLHRTLEKIRQFILENFEAVAMNSQFFKLSTSQLEVLLSSDNLHVSSEFKLFQLIIQWIIQSNDREQCVPALISNIRLPLLSGEELVEHVSRVPLMQENRLCAQLLSEAKDYHIVILKQPLMQNTRTQVRNGRPSLVLCHGETIDGYNIDTHKHISLKEPPQSLYNPSVCVIDNFLYVCGGKYDNSENNEIATARCFRYDPRFDVWVDLPSMNEARNDFALIASGHNLYAIAGQDENVVLCSMEKFSIEKNEWEECTNLRHAVYGHAAALCGDRVYVAGGHAFEGICSNVYSFSIAHGTWREEPMLSHPRANHNMLTVAHCIYVLGGNVEDTYGFPLPVTTVEKFNPTTLSWTILDISLNIREAGTAVLDKYIYIVGGLNGQHFYSNKLERFHIDTKRVELVDEFQSRIYGRACCFLTLPYNA